MKTLTKHMMLLTVLASAVGSLLEMYDFVIYALFAGVISHLFFPSADSFASLLATFGTFAVGYFARPLGGILIGHLTDRFGRRRGLTWSVVAMGVSMILIAVCPTHETIGDFSAVLLILCRVLQGLSVGGEFPSASTFITEHAPFERRGFFTSWIFFGINVGILLATLISYWLIHLLSPQELATFGWRLAFGFGGLLAFIGYWIRRALPESPVFEAMTKKKGLAKFPLWSVVKEQKLDLVRAFFIVAVMAVAIGSVFLFMPEALTKFAGMSLNQALFFNLINLTVFCCFIPIVGILCDRLGRSQEVLFVGALAFFILAYPLYYILFHFIGLAPDLSLWALVMLGLISSVVVAPIGFTLPEMFAAKHRSMGVGIGYNLSYAVFGGLTPLVLITIFHESHNSSRLAFGLMGAGVLSMIALLTLRRRDKSGIA